MKGLCDNRRSCLTKREIKKFKGEVTKEKSISVCSAFPTLELSQQGAYEMLQDNHSIVTEKTREL